MVDKVLKNNIRKTEGKKPPERSGSALADIWNFLIFTPKYKTYIRFKTFKDRLDFRQRIMQRIGMDASHYSVLNVHKIGIDAPANYIFEELLNWNGDSTCWPNHIAKVDRINNTIENIQILPFGRSTYPFGIKNGIFGAHFIPLFNLNAQKIQSVPISSDADNARYILYKCSGGYPIGFYTMYVRSSIAHEGEKEQSQLFFGVGFDFFGKKSWAKTHIVVKFWALIHNKVTQNVMNRFKQLAEWRFEKIQKG